MSLELFSVVRIFPRSLTVFCSNRWVLSEGQNLNTSRIGASWTHRLNFWFWTLFNLMKWPYYQKDKNQINLNHNTLWNLALPIFEVFFRSSLIVNLFFNHFPNILVLRETNLDDSTDSGTLTVRGYLSLLRKDSITHNHGLVVYVKHFLLNSP